MTVENMRYIVDNTDDLTVYELLGFGAHAPRARLRDARAR